MNSSFDAYPSKG